MTSSKKIDRWKQQIVKMLVSGNAELIALANAISVMRQIPTRRIDTAATDGIVVLYNPEFVDTLTETQLVGLMAHELMHVHLRHSERFKSSGWMRHDAANMAMDDEINSVLIERGFDLPADACLPEQHDMERLKSWETYYPSRCRWLDDQQQPDMPEQDGQPESGDGEPGGDSGSASSGNASSSDSGESSGAESASDGQSGAKSGDESSGENGTGNDGGSDARVEDGCHATGELAREFCPDELNGDDADTAAKAAEVANEVAEQVEAQLRDSSLGEPAKPSQPGNESGGIVFGQDVQPVTLASGSDERWQDLVIETFRSGRGRRLDWSRRSRRMQPGSKSYLPGRRRANGMALALIIDVSGSCTQYLPTWQALANELIDEVHNIERLEVIFHGRDVVGEILWTRAEGYVDMPHQSGGGTDHRDMFRWIEGRDVDGLILFTDCETRWPEMGEYPGDDELPCVTVIPKTRYAKFRCPFGVNVLAEAN